MFKNYLLVTFRNLAKNRVFTVINIIGLGVGLALCIVAFFNHMFNYEFDRTHENFKEIYRVTSFRDMQGREQEYGIVPATLGLHVKNDIPGIKNSARLIRSTSPVKEGENLFSSQISYIDPAFLDIFSFPVISGQQKAIDDHGSILVSAEMAEKLFGDEYPIGKSVVILNDENKEYTYTVSAVFKDLPENSSFRIDILTHIDNFLLMWDVKDYDWKLWANVFFIQVPDRSNLPSITRSLMSYLQVQNEAREDFRINRFNLIPLKDVGKKTREIWGSNLFPSLHPAALIAPPIMAVFILLIACFNFANTSIATFSKRLREIGLRKTFGGQRKQLMTQFMLETLIICFLALIAALVIAEFLVPAYSSLWAYMTIELSLTEYPVFWVFLLFIMLLTGFAAGVYPALYVSSFNPVDIMKGTTHFRGSGKLSLVFLSLQFSISITALILGIVFSFNASYQKTLDLGYDRDKLIVVPVSPEMFTSFRNELLTNPKIIAAEGSQNHIGFGAYRRPLKDIDKQLEVDVLDIGPEYASTMGLRLTEGRLFDKDRAPADRANNSIVVNRKFVSDFGWKEAIGKTVTLYDTTRLEVIGVVEDFYTSGLWEEINPTMLRLTRSEEYGILAVRSDTENLASVLEYINARWKAMIPNYVFRGILQEDTMQEEKEINRSITKVNIFLAVVAALLSLVGMYNMVSLDIIHRTKEVGIRKIQGTPVPTIMYLLSKKFIIVLAVSSLLGCIGGYYLSEMLLDSIWDYFIEITAGFLLLAVAMMVLATAATLTLKITKAARINPAQSLKYE